MISGTIGVVNQDPQKRKLLDDVLRGEGYSTLFVPASHEAYELIKSSQPDLVMLDTQMDAPGNGWQLVQELRLDIQTAKLPLLILRTDDDEDVESKAPALARYHHVEVMPAPFDPGFLVSKIKGMLADRAR